MLWKKLWSKNNSWLWGMMYMIWFQDIREVRSIFHMDLQEQVYKARIMICLRKNRLWHDILYWPVYIKHGTTCTEWRRKIILHFRKSDNKRYLSLTRYDMMYNFLMDRDFTKSKVGSSLQSWMQKTRICWWSDKTNSWKMLWWKNLEWCLGYSSQTRRKEYSILQMDMQNKACSWRKY